MKQSKPVKFCHNIIGDVSRTFALSIEKAGDLLSDHTCIGYLLCRIPDTIEDFSGISTDKKVELLKVYMKILQNKKKRYELIDEFIDSSKQYEIRAPEKRLIKNTGKVFKAFEGFYGDVRNSMKSHISTMIEGMSEIIQEHRNGVRIHDMKEFSKYCYYVAGTVGGLLTDLFQITEDLSQQTTKKLKKYSDNFGEALQTVNIIKNVYTDFEDENSVYIPQSLLKKEGTNQERILIDKEKSLKAIGKLRKHSKQNLVKSKEYIKTLPTRAKGARRFTIIPYLLAVSTLRETKRREKELLEPEPVKINKSEVFSILDRLPECVEDNGYLERLASEAREREITSETSV